MSKINFCGRLKGMKGGRAVYINRLNENLKKKYGCKVYKLSLTSGCSCPKRDKDNKKGCIFCDGAGAFAAHGTVKEQIEEAKERISKKVKGEIKYISYFQSFTNTYASADYLRPLFMAAIEPEDVVALSVATRPDCLGDDILELLSDINKIKPVWVELGLQTINEETAKYIRRGYKLPTFDKAVKDLKEMNIEVIVHQIIGLPNETKEDMVNTSRYIGKSGADGIKLHLLHIIDGTELAEEWKEGKIKTLTMDEYIDILKSCVESLPKNIVIHRLTGDGAKKDLLAPLWSGNKKVVLNSINKAFLDADVEQGRNFF